MKVLLTTLNAKYIHKNLALRWLYVASQKPRDVELKEFVIKDDPLRIAEEIIKTKCDVVAFSVYIWNIEQTKEVIQLCKQKKLSLHVIVGGPEVTYESFHLLQQGIDAISLGEGEQSFWNYIDMLESGTFYEVAGMYTKQFPNQEVQKVDVRFNETLPSPYFLEMDKKDMGKRYLYFETSRGCPYGCAYCLSSTDQKVRMFSEEYVLEQLKRIAVSDVKQVKFLDRTFNANPKRALRIARFINTHCTNQVFQFEIVAETLSEELLQFFCEEADPKRFRFEIGVQSFNCKTLESVGRIQNNQRLREVIERMKQANLIMHVDLIAGLPYEDMDSFAKSFNTLFALEASEVQLGVLKLLKGTKLRKMAENYDFVYEENAPYTIQETSWLNKEELGLLEDCAMAVEKFWNRGTTRKTLQTFLELKFYDGPFQMFMELGKELKKLPRPYAKYQLFQLCQNIAKHEEQRLVDAIILSEYYATSKQKPKRFTDVYVTVEKRKSLLKEAAQQGIAKKEDLFHYGAVDLAYWNGQIGYQIILYASVQAYPKRWFYQEEKKEFEVMSE